MDNRCSDCDKLLRDDQVYRTPTRGQYKGLISRCQGCHEDFIRRASRLVPNTRTPSNGERVDKRPNPWLGL